ncbi:MAG: SCO family protein [Robiginitomaculum sp.]|nr:SCO family protein [Robiginitomaculum sp.]
MSRIIFKRLVAGLCTAIAISAMAACSDNNNNLKARSGQVTAVSGKAAIGGAYNLVDHTGKPVTDIDFHGKAQLIYFGFAYCPDICPTALQQMGAALALSGKAADYYQPIFITIDSERDTPKMLAQYVTNNGFPDNLIGLTGNPEQLKHVMKVFKVIGQKVEDPKSASGYTYDHSSIIYMMDKNGMFVDVFTHTTTPQQIADRLISYKKTGR